MTKFLITYKLNGIKCYLETDDSTPLLKLNADLKKLGATNICYQVI